MPRGVPPEWTPPESSGEIFAEHTWLQGALLAGVAYGIEFVLYIMACYLLWIHRNRSDPEKKKNLFFIGYITIIFVLSTLYTAGLFEFTQEAFIDGRNIPGGPNAFQNEMFSLPIDMLANVIMVLVTWLCDIVNIWRCFVVYQGGTFSPWMVVGVPILMYMTSVAFGILFLKQVGTVNQSPWDTVGINFTLPYYAMSLSLNLLVTFLIVIRLLYHRRKITQALGPSHGSHYTSLVAMVVESAAIYSAFDLAFIIPFAVESAVAQLFLQALSPIQALCTFLIIFRIAQGKGWSRDAHTNMLTSTFNNTQATRTIGGTAIVGKHSNNSKQRSVRSGDRNFSADGEEPIMLTNMHMQDGTPSVHSQDKEKEGVTISKSVFVDTV